MNRAKIALLILSLAIISGCAAQSAKLLKSAELSILHGHNDDALNQINQAVAIDSNSVEVIQARADLYLRMNRRQQAITDLGRILELDPKSIQTYMTRGILYSVDGRNDLALQDFRRACALRDESGCIFSKELEKK
jgi:Tfp pilus assembly protein PilF